MPMPAWLDRLRALWKRVFFWQNPEGSGTIPDAHHDHALVLHVTQSRKLPRWHQWRFLHRVLTRQERGMFWSGIFVAMLATAVASIDLIRPHLVTVPVSGGMLTEALIGTPKLINPLFAPQNDVDRDLVALIYSGLFRLNERLDAEPDLAESYRWLEDGSVLEVRIRDDARFHNGEPVTADDVIFTYEAVKNPTWRSPLHTVYRGIRVIRVDEQTVQFHLETPNASFLYDLTLGILPAHLWNEVSDTNAHLADINLKPIGSGPYRVVSFTRDAKGALLTYHLRLFNNAYGLKPYLMDRVFRFFADRTQAEEALKANQVDALAFMPWGEVALIKNENLRAVALSLPQETVAFFNIKDETLKQEKIRQALALAVDRDELATLVGSHVTRVDSPYPLLDATTTVANLEQARLLLDQAGWKLAENASVRTFIPPGTRATPSATSTSSTPFSLTIDVPNQPDLLKVAEALKRRWSLLGAQVSVHSDDAETLLRKAQVERNGQVLIYNVLLQPDQDLRIFWASDRANERGLNLSNLSDRDVDAALDTLATATTTQAIAAGRLAVSEAILARTPALFLLRPTYAYLISKSIQDVHHMTISRPADRLIQSREWYVKTGWRWR